MKKDNSEKTPSFKIALFAVVDYKGIIRNSKGPPWNNSPWIIEQLNKTVYGKMTLMGNRTYKSFVEHADKANNFLLKDTSMTFVISKEPNCCEIKEEHNAHIINAIKTVQPIYWILKENFKKVTEAGIKECFIKQQLATNKKEKENLAQAIQSIQTQPIPIAPEIVVLGGVSLYEEMLDYAHIIYTVLFHGEFDGEEHFPLFFNLEEWQLIHSIDSREKMADGHCRYTLICYRRKKPPKKYLYFFKPDLRFLSLIEEHEAGGT